MKQLFSRFKARYSEQQKESLKQYVTSKFELRERDGKMYLTCSGIAIKFFDENTTLKDAMQELDAMRNCAINYSLFAVE